MNIGHLVASLLDYAAAAGLPDGLRSPSGVLLVAALLAAGTGSALYAIARPVVVLIKKLGPVDAAIDAVTRLTHTRGRNRSRDILCRSIAENGTAQDRLTALQEINRISPMDAPGTGFLERLPDPALPGPREPRETAIVVPHPAGGRHRAQKRELT